MQTLEQAKEIDLVCKNLLDTTQINYKTVEAGLNSLEVILDDIINQINISKNEI